MIFGGGRDLDLIEITGSLSPCPPRRHRVWAALHPWIDRGMEFAAGLAIAAVIVLALAGGRL